MGMKSSVAGLLMLSLTLACQSSSSGHQAFPHRVSFEMGEVEFYGGDGIVIEEVLGTAPVYRPGEEYLVRGKYQLESQSSAILLLSTTTFGPSAVGSTVGTQQVRVARGTGEFELRHVMPAPGSPHLTFYGRGNAPFGGVYFGTGESVLAKKSWSYRKP